MNNYCRFFKIMNIYYVKLVIFMNDIFHKMIQKNRSYFLFFMHLLLCNLFVFFIFFFISLTVIAGKEKDLLESKKKIMMIKIYILLYMIHQIHIKKILYIQKMALFFFH